MKIFLSKLLFGTFIIGCSSVFAQSNSPTNVVAGLSQTWVHNGKNNAVNIPGFTIGINKRFALATHIHFQPEVLLINRVTGYTKSTSNSSVKAKSVSHGSSTMIQIPLWLQFGSKTYFGVGIGYGLPFRSKTFGTVTTTTSNPTVTNTQNFSQKESFQETFYYKQFDFGLSLGNRNGKIGWEIRPSLSTIREGHFWRNVGDLSTFQVSGVLIYEIR